MFGILYIVMHTSVSLILVLNHMLIMVTIDIVILGIVWLDHIRHLTNRRDDVTFVIVLDLIFSKDCSCTGLFVSLLALVAMHNAKTTSNFARSFFFVFGFSVRGSFR